MKVVVDSNQLQENALRHFLGASAQHVAVLTDYASMEAYKGDTLANIYERMAILSEFPRQVVVLKGTMQACGMSGRLSGLQRRLIDAKQTQGFPRYCEDLRRAKLGDRPRQQALVALGLEASSHLDRMLSDARGIASAIGDISKLYSKAERLSVREGFNCSDEMFDKMVRHIIHVSGCLFGAHPAVRSFPSYAELPNTFLFRVSLCLYLLALDWGVRGGVKDVRSERLRNDVVDMNFVAFATYFDGLLTVDAKAKRIHDEARLWLQALFRADVAPARTWSATT